MNESKSYVAGSPDLSMSAQETCEAAVWSAEKSAVGAREIRLRCTAPTTIGAAEAKVGWFKRFFRRNKLNL